MKKQIFISMVVAALAVGLWSALASAQDENMEMPPLPDTGAGDAAVAPQPETAASDAGAEPSPAKGAGLKELPGVGYHSVGMRFRWIFLPKWMITMFGVDIAAKNEKHPLVSNLGVGVEYTYRKDNFDITAAIWGAQLDWEDPIYFKNGSEPDTAWTEVRNGLSALLFTADFIWSSPITDMVAITYGVGLGMGFTIGGDIIQTEAYPDSSNGGELTACNGPNSPNAEYCEPDGEYHDVYDKLPVVPWINLLVGARIKPQEHLAIYLDGGFGIGFQMGVRAGYIF